MYFSMFFRQANSLKPAGPVLAPCRLKLATTGVPSAKVAQDLQNAPAPKPLSAMPGPKPLPLVGNVLKIKENMTRLGSYYDECFNKYGDIFKLYGLAGTNNIVCIKDPSTLEFVLRAEGKYPIRDVFVSPAFAWLLRTRLKRHVFFTVEEGKRWKELRTAVGKQATPRNVQTYYQNFNDIFHRFTEYIHSARDKDETIKDLALPLKRLLMEISSRFVFDSDMNVVANPSPDDQAFIDAVGVIVGMFTRIGTELPLYRLYHSKLSRDLDAALEIVHRKCKSEIDRIYANVSAGKESKTPGLLEQWLREGKLSEEAALSEAVGMFMAGVDTTANQSVFLLHSVAGRPEVQEKLYAEVKSVLGDSKQATPQDLAKMPYLKGCILESFRRAKYPHLYLSIPSPNPIEKYVVGLNSTIRNFTRALQENTVLLGYHIPAKTTVIYSLYSAGRDSSLFPDPMKFDPERWKRDETPAFAIQPFGFGPRGCYGRRFAELELKLLLVQMVCNFEMEAEQRDLEVTERAVAIPSQDVTMKFKERAH